MRRFRTAVLTYQKLYALLGVLLLNSPSLCFAEVDSVDAEFPEKPSMVPGTLLGVDRDNWRTFGVSCSSLDDAISRYAEDDRWGTFYGEPDAKIHWTNCLESIEKIKSALEMWKKTRPKVVSIRNSIADRHGKSFPLKPINWGISNHLSNQKNLDKNILYAINVYRPRYRILQKFENQEALFADTEGEWPPVYFIAPGGVVLDEGEYLNAVADYYSYQGVYEYLNRDGFERKAFIFKGHTDSSFRGLYTRAVEARRWIDGKVNTDGM